MGGADQKWLNLSQAALVKQQGVGVATSQKENYLMPSLCMIRITNNVFKRRQMYASYNDHIKGDGQVLSQKAKPV